MPTSKMRLGNASPNRSRPVPEGIAAVMATILSSNPAYTRVFADSLVQEAGALAGGLACAPVITSNLLTP
jgi:hypothetical protein